MKKSVLLLCLISFLPFFNLQAAETKENESIYKPKDYSHLIGMPGFTDEALKMHFKLYQGYVTNTNLLLGLIKQYATEGKDKTAQFAEIKRRVMWEFDGMRLHEDYFSNLGGKGTNLESDSPLYNQIVQDFGSFDKWKSDFMATGAMRGIGWAVLVFDSVSKRLFNVWINEHDRGHLAGGEPILIMDVFEHAYMLDYGLDRGKYIQSFFDNIDWNAVSKRFPEQKEQES
ncbi:MAG: Superoxide dismutase [Fe] [Chlamydiae bacterium]|nr:Superoxide dismutase [Fe] [Chlamydiota bacterium]